MTQEDKQLLLKDLCARLPYGVKCVFHSKNGDIPSTIIRIDTENETVTDRPVGQKDESLSYLHLIEHIKPYLRPMSSMTEDEKMEWFKMRQNHCDMSGFNEIQERANFTSESSDWLNSNHFDYRIVPSTGKTMIDSGLALEAPPGMYNKEEPEKESEIPIPKTVDEAVKTLAKILSKEDRDYLLENGAISMHDSLGRWIRNEWGLWTGSELKDELMNMNKGLNHPDDMSNYIIEEFIKYCNEKGKDI